MQHRYILTRTQLGVAQVATTSFLPPSSRVNLCGRMRLMTLFVIGALVTKSCDMMLIQNPIMEV